MDQPTVQLDRDALLNLFADSVRASNADQTEIVLEARQHAVTRFANNEIHQNVAEDNTRISVRAIVGSASARAFTNELTPAAIRNALANATAAAQRQAPNNQPVQLPQANLGYLSPVMANLQPPTSAIERAEWVATMVDAVKNAGFVSFGTVMGTLRTILVVNSLGLRSFATAPSIYLRVLVDNGQGTGYADSLGSTTISDPSVVVAEAIAKCRMNVNQIELPAGEYVAILEPNCLADFVRFPVIYGMGADSIEQGRSFMSGHLGQLVTGTQVSIWDDPADPNCLPMPIDYEGVAAQRINLIDRGIATNFATDATTAYRLQQGAFSNGHASNPWDGSTQVADNIIMDGGTASADELMHDLKRGLRITRLHYTHCPDPKRVIATGTTRDGTFLVENGEIVAAVKNMRFTQPVLDLLASIEAVGERKTCRDWWAANGMETTNYLLPAVRVGRCTITGVTTF